MGIFGDLSRTKLTTPPESSATNDQSGQGSVGDTPLRITSERMHAEREKTRKTDTPGETQLAQSTALSPTKQGSHEQSEDKQEKKEAGLEDLPLKSTNEQIRPQAEQSQNPRAHGQATQATEGGSVTGPGAGADASKATILAPETLAEPEKRRPRSASGGLWAAVVLLALALVGVSGYGYLIIHKNRLPLSQLPGVEQLVGTLGTRLEATEAKLRDLTANWDSLSAQVAALNAKMRTGLQNARTQTEELIMQEQERIEAEMDKRDQAINARLARVEADQKRGNERLAQVEDQMQESVNAVHQEIAAERESNGGRLNALRQEVGQSRDELRSLASKVERERVDFEAAKNQTHELVPGVSLTVTRTDPRYQRFQGYLTLIDDARTLWLSNMSAQQALPFYLKQDGQPYDLVVTTVSRDGVVGYVLVPRGKIPGAGETASGG